MFGLLTNEKDWKRNISRKGEINQDVNGRNMLRIVNDSSDEHSAMLSHPAVLCLQMRAKVNGLLAGWLCFVPIGKLSGHFHYAKAAKGPPLSCKLCAESLLP